MDDAPLTKRPDHAVEEPESDHAVPSKLRALILSLAFEGLGVGYLIVFVAAYLPENGLGPNSVGLLLGLFGLVTLAAALPIGLLSDRKGRKKIFLLGLFGFPFELLVFSLTSSLLFLVASVVCIAVSEAANLTTWNAIMADQTTSGNRDKTFSLAFTVNLASIGIGSSIPLAFPLLQQALGLDVGTIHRAFMALVALMAFTSPVAASILLRGYREIPKTEGPERRIGSVRKLLKFSGINSLVGLGSGLIIPLVPTWLLLKFQVSDSYSGPLLGVAGITIGLAAFASPRLTRRYGQVRTIAMVQGAGTIFMLGTGLAPTALLAASFYLGRAAFMNMASPVSDSYLMGIIEKEQRGFASALNSVMWNLPNSASTIVGGFILASGNYAMPFLIAALFYAASSGLFYTAFRSVEARN
jgi:MFS family permease